MDIKTFEEAQRLHNRYLLCENLMEYLSDESAAKGQKYLDALRRFAAEFRVEFMTLVHAEMEKAGMAFEDLHCECRPGSETEATPEP